MALRFYLIVDAWKWFWTPSFWLPGNTTWDDFVDTPEISYPRISEITYPVVYSIVVFFIRFLIERYITYPLL